MVQTMQDLNELTASQITGFSYMESKFKWEISKWMFLKTKIKSGTVLDSEWISVLDSSNVEFCKWKVRIQVGPFYDRDLRFGLIFDRDLTIVLNAHLRLNIRQYDVKDHESTIKKDELNRFFGDVSSILERFDYLRPQQKEDNFLSINIEIKIGTGISNTFKSNAKLPFLPENKLVLNKAIKSLLTDEKYTDVMLKVGNQTFSSHKAILSARSPVFAAMFESEMKELELGLVEIVDINDDVFGEMLHYIYTDEIPNLTTLAFELLSAGDKYELPNLVLKCVNKIIEQVSIQNAVEILVLAEQHNCVELKTVVIQFIRSHQTEICENETFAEWAKVHPNLLVEILTSPGGNQTLTSPFKVNPRGNQMIYYVIIPVCAFLLFKWIQKPKPIEPKHLMTILNRV